MSTSHDSSRLLLCAHAFQPADRVVNVAEEHAAELARLEAEVQSLVQERNKKVKEANKLREDLEQSQDICGFFQQGYEANERLSEQLEEERVRNASLGERMTSLTDSYFRLETTFYNFGILVDGEPRPGDLDAMNDRQLQREAKRNTNLFLFMLNAHAIKQGYRPPRPIIQDQLNVVQRDPTLTRQQLDQLMQYGQRAVEARAEMNSRRENSAGSDTHRNFCAFFTEILLGLSQSIPANSNGNSSSGR